MPAAEQGEVKIDDTANVVIDDADDDAKWAWLGDPEYLLSIVDPVAMEETVRAFETFHAQAWARFYEEEAEEAARAEAAESDEQAGKGG